MSKAKIAVIGAGLMGHGIAQVFALAGHEVTVSDTVMKNLDTLAARIAANLRDLGEDESAIARVRPCVDVGDAVHGVDYVVEAVFEDLALKQKLFAEIEAHVRPDTILASNTSVFRSPRSWGASSAASAHSERIGGIRPSSFRSSK